MAASSTHRIGMRTVNTCAHGNDQRDCNWCATAMPDELVHFRGAPSRRNGVGGALAMPVVGVLSGVAFTWVQGDRNAPSLIIGAVVGGILGTLARGGGPELGGDEATTNPGPLISAAAGAAAREAPKAGGWVAGKIIGGSAAKQVREWEQSEEYKKLQEMDTGDEDRDDGDEAEENPGIPWLRTLVVIGGTGAAIWALNRFEVI